MRGVGSRRESEGGREVVSQGGAAGSFVIPIPGGGEGVGVKELKGKRAMKISREITRRG